MSGGSVSTALGLARSLVIYYGQPWRRRALRKFYAGLVHPGDLVFDIGAHVGSRARTLLGHGARVVAVEPQPALADFVAATLGLRLVALERVAVGASHGEAELAISSRHPTVSSISRGFVETAGATAGFRGVTWDRNITVPLVTLDHLIAKYGLPAFCKLDVEGAEAEILAGLSQPLALIALEYSPSMPQITVAAVERLATLGTYRFNRVIGERHRFVDADWKSAKAVLADLAALGPDAPSGDLYARLETDPAPQGRGPL